VRVDDEVAEHVADRARNFGRSAQDVGVVPVRKDLALAVHHAVQPPGDADGQPLQTARELFRVGRLDDQLDVVPLYREVDQAESGAIATIGESGCELSEGAPASQVPHMWEHAPGDVNRVMPR
jgi:hypothetical protein